MRPTNKPGGVSDRHMLPVPWALRNPSNPRHTFPLGSRMPFELPGQHGTPAPMIGPMIGYHWTSRLAHAVREQRDDEGLSGYHVSTRASPAFRLSLTSPLRVVHSVWSTRRPFHAVRVPFARPPPPSSRAPSRYEIPSRDSARCAGTRRVTWAVRGVGWVRTSGRYVKQHVSRPMPLSSLNDF